MLEDDNDYEVKKKNRVSEIQSYWEVGDVSLQY